MTRNDIIASLRAARAELESMGVQQLRLFGSAARDTVRVDSDVDLVVEIAPGRPIGLGMVRLHRRLEERLGRDVDLIRAPLRNPELKAAVQRDGIDAFE